MSSLYKIAIKQVLFSRFLAAFPTVYFLITRIVPYKKLTPVTGGQCIRAMWGCQFTDLASKQQAIVSEWEDKEYESSPHFPELKT